MTCSELSPPVCHFASFHSEKEFVLALTLKMFFYFSDPFLTCFWGINRTPHSGFTALELLLHKRLWLCHIRDVHRSEFKLHAYKKRSLCFPIIYKCKWEFDSARPVLAYEAYAAQLEAALSIATFFLLLCNPNKLTSCFLLPQLFPFSLYFNWEYFAVCLIKFLSFHFSFIIHNSFRTVSDVSKHFFSKYLV